MRKIVFVVLSLAAFPVAAQQQPTAPPGKGAPAGAAQTDNGKQQMSDAEWRRRTEGAVGGTQPVPEREREGVGAGAKPHMHFDALARGLHRRSEAEVITPPQ